MTELVKRIADALFAIFNPISNDRNHNVSSHIGSHDYLQFGDYRISFRDITITRLSNDPSTLCIQFDFILKDSSGLFIRSERFKTLNVNMEGTQDTYTGVMNSSYAILKAITAKVYETLTDRSDGKEES